jgi:hypothetical protein
MLANQGTTVSLFNCHCVCVEMAHFVLFVLQSMWFCIVLDVTCSGFYFHYYEMCFV